MQDSQRLEDADQIRDAHQPIGVDDAIGIALHLVKGPVRDATQERAGVFVAHAPSLHDAEESLEARS